MTAQRSTRVDRILPELLAELADARTTPAYLEAAIERASSRPQRPAWTYPGRWLPVQITTGPHPATRGLSVQLAVLALIGVLIALAAVAYVGSQQARLTVKAPPFGPAANGAIAVGGDGDIFVADRPGGDLRPLVVGPEEDRSPLYSPDGTRLAFIRDTPVGSFLMLADADGTNVVRIPQGFTEWDGSWSFAPDGRSLMTTAGIAGDWRVVVRPVDPAAPLTVLGLQLLDSSMVRSWAKPAFNPTNPREILVVAQLERDAPRNEGGLYVYDLVTGGIRTIVEPADERAFQDIAWLPNGQHIIYRIGGEPHIVAANGSGDRVMDALRGRASPLSNDGSRIVAVRAGPNMDRSLIVPIDGDGEPVWLTCNLATPSCPNDWIWSPDDSMLIGTIHDETSSGGLEETYLLVDAHTGQLTELDWVDVGTPAWQRVEP